MDPNKFGLKRYIPEKIKLEIRRRSKFGCVHCRFALYQYEHISPEYQEAREHDPDNMCLLCGHCHDNVTRGRLSKKTVRRDYLAIQKDDKAKPPCDEFDLRHGHITVKLGSSIFRYSKKLIVLDGTTVLAIEPPEEGSTFPVLSGCFTDEQGNELLRIEKNEWSGTCDVWDSEIRGNEIIIRTAPDRTALRLRVDPPETIEIVELDMRVGQSHLLLSEDTFAVGRILPNAEYYIGIDRIVAHGAAVGVLVDCEKVSPQITGWSMIGGEGIDLKGTGIKVAVGAAGMHVKGLRIVDANRERTIVTEYPLTENLEARRTSYPPGVGNPFTQKRAR